jgi:lipopolysaccharide transport system permease protein
MKTRIDSKSLASFRTALGDFKRDWQLALSFARRDVRIKYERTRLGLAWLFLNPIITVGVFTFVFGLLVKIPSDGLPYLVFYLVAILIWNFFSSLLNINASAIDSYYSLLSKVYFAKLAIPAGNLIVLSIDFVVVSTLVVGLGLYYQLPVALFLLSALPAFLITGAFGTGLGLILANLTFKIRDIKMGLPLVLQLFFFANPIIYPSSVIPENLRWIAQLNPVQTSIDLVRASLKAQEVSLLAILPGTAISLVVLGVGTVVFIRSSLKTMDVR